MAVSFVRFGDHVISLEKIVYVWFVHGDQNEEVAYFDFGPPRDGWGLILTGQEAELAYVYFTATEAESEGGK